MLRTRPIPWNNLDRQLDRHGEWLLVGSIASAGLAPVPGVVALIALVGFFLLRHTKELDPTIRRYSLLKHKQHKTKAEEIELSEFEANEVLSPPKRDYQTYTIGYGSWILAAFYLVAKGYVEGKWLF